MNESLVIAGRIFRSRLILGTGKFSSPEAMRDALEASGAEMVTVALRRADLSGKGDPFANILEFIDPTKFLLLPNTSGAMNADEAVRLAGVKPEEVTDVVISHAHWDHMGGIDLFPKATVWIQKEEFRYYTGQAWQPGGDHGGMADNGDQIPLAARLHTQHGEAVFLVVERDALNEPSEDLGTALSRVRFHREQLSTEHQTPSAGTRTASCFRGSFRKPMACAAFA